VSKLVLYMPDGTLHDIPLDKERVTIGRRPDNDVCLPYPAVSGEHAQVVTILDDSFLEDLGSTNGTLVNGKAIVKHFLRDNDLIDIGRQRLIYFSDNAVRVEPLPPDVLRRAQRGLVEQVQRANRAREPERRKPLAAPGAGGLGTADPLTPDDELLAEIESGGLPGECDGATAGPPVPPAPTDPPAAKAPVPGRPAHQPASDAPAQPVQRRASSTVASRLSSTWSYEEPKPERAPVAPIELPEDVVAPSQSNHPAPAPAYWLRVLSGPSAGRELALTRDECSVGRVGTQVARLAQKDGRWRLALVEGAAPVKLNGAPVPADGTPLAPGDRFEVAGTELAFERR
jgi:hypothetical protein